MRNRYWYVLLAVLISTSAFSKGFEQRNIGSGAYQQSGDIVLNVQCDVIGKCILTGEAPAGVNQIQIRGESSEGDVVEANVNVGPGGKIQYETARLNPVQWQFEVMGENATAGTKVVAPAIAPIKIEKLPMPQITVSCGPHHQQVIHVGKCTYRGSIPAIYNRVNFKHVNVSNRQDVYMGRPETPRINSYTGMKDFQYWGPVRVGQREIFYEISNDALGLYDVESLGVFVVPPND